jgi:alpha-tubulin suppressor-like RCC1 family protein
VVALTADGRVLAWGNNEHGQCDVPEGLNDVVQVVAGYRYSGALRADGEAVFWGQYNFSPEPLADFKEIVQMVVSQNGPVFLRADGTVWRLYRSGSEKISRADRIVQIAGSSDFLMLDAEHRVHGVDVPGWLGPTAALMKTGPMCNTFGVILRDGTVRMWGPNDAGQAMVPPTLRNVVKLIGTNSATYAIGAEGEVVAWGTNYDGTLTLPEKLGRVIDVIPGSSMVALLVEP